MGEIHLPVLPASAVRHQRGASSELLACAALMLAGYHVYRCESPHAPFDVVAYRDGSCSRVEVKSISFGNHGYAPGFGWPTNDEWDLLMIVGPDRVFCFEPGTSRDEVQAAIRTHYGYATLAVAIERTCERCDKSFVSRAPNARFCSASCRAAIRRGQSARATEIA